MSASAQTDLLRVLKHFTLKEIYHYAIKEFPDILWEDIVNDLSYSKKRTSQAEVINIILKLVTQAELNTDQIYGIIDNLELLAVAISTKKTWVAYKLFDHKYVIPSTAHSLFKKCLSSFKRNSIPVTLNVIDHEGKFVLSIAKRTSPRKKGAKAKVFSPVYFIFDSTQQYFFSNKILTDLSFNGALANGFGYQSFKQCKLSGRNIDDLLKLLRFKEKNKERIEFEVPEFVPKAKITENGIDYTRRTEKKDFADKIFGEPAPELQSLTFKVENQPFQSSLLKGETFSVDIQFVSPDVIQLVKDCVADNVIEYPVPEYLQNVLKQGKNIFHAKNDKD